jgi:hypothetical protein
MVGHDVMIKTFGVNLATALYGGSVTYKEWLVPQPNI